MDLRRVKRWQWAVVGTLAGLALGTTSILRSNDELIGGEGFIAQREFESLVTRSAVVRPSPVSSLTLRTTGQVDIVTVDLAGRSYFSTQVRFAAARPFKPRAQPELYNANYTVRDFLLPLAAQNPALQARYPWWEELRWKLTFWTIGSATFVVLIWPTIIVLLLGKLPPEPPAIKLTHPPESQPKKRELTAEELKHLEELESEMMAGMASTAEPLQAQTASAVVQSTTVKQLATEAVQTALPPAEDDREYAGEYYPVAKKPPHAFTVVELLVTIGLIVFLLAMLLPVLSLSRERAKKVQCAGNLKQIGAGLEMYNQTHKHLPEVATAKGLSDAMGEMNIGGIMTCPSDGPGVLSYTMTPSFAGMPKSAGEATDVLASETGGRHGGKSNVLFFDGHVDDQ